MQFRQMDQFAAMQWIRAMELGSQFAWEESSWWTVASMVTALAAAVAFVTKLRNDRARAKLPPGPKPLPVIGNLHQLGPLPHQSLWELSKQHGPIMYLQLGVHPLVVASTAEAAQEFVKQDIKWADRPPSIAGKIFSHNFRNLVIAPHGPHWRHMRKICVLELFSQRRMESFRPPRTEELGQLVRSVYDDCVAGNPVSLTLKFGHFAGNNITRMLLGKRFFETDTEGQKEASRFKALVFEIFTLASSVKLGDFLPWLKWTTHVTGYVRHLKKVKANMDAYLQVFLDVKKNGTAMDTDRREDFVDVLMAQPSSEKGDGKLDDDAIRGVILDMLFAGTDTSANGADWALSALLRHPAVMRKLHAELDAVVGTDRIVTEADLPNLPYLQAVVKETFRLYPPTPLNIPHQSTERTSVWGYEFPARTRLFINLYAIHRDPKVWDRPLEFDPERFLEHPEIDMRGNFLGLIPFGAGRRQCPGMPLAILFVQMGVARLVQAFDFSLPNGMGPEDLDMSELFGVSMPRKIPLTVVAKPRLPAHLY